MTNNIALIVEDDRDTAHALSELAHSVDLRTCVVCNMTDALEMAGSVDFDVVFLGLSIPGHQGVEAIELMKTKAPQSPIVVVVSDLESGGDRLDTGKLLGMGVSAVLCKLTTEDFRQALAIAFQRRDAQNTSTAVMDSVNELKKTFSER